MMANQLIEVIIKIDSETYHFHVDEHISVIDLKELISTETGILPEHQRLIYRKAVLKKEQHLSDHEVQNRHSIELFVREPVPGTSQEHPGSSLYSSPSNHTYYVAELHLHQLPGAFAPVVMPELPPADDSLIIDENAIPHYLLPRRPRRRPRQPDPIAEIELSPRSVNSPAPPAPQGARGAPAPPAPQGARGAPAPPAPRGARGAPALPAPRGAPALPAPRGAPALPAPRGAPALPAPRGAPAPPAPRGAPALPAPQGARGAPAPPAPRGAPVRPCRNSRVCGDRRCPCVKAGQKCTDFCGCSRHRCNNR